MAALTKPTPPVSLPSLDSNNNPLCPQCKRPLRKLPAMPGELGEWYCPIALEARYRGLLGKPGKVHNEVWVWTEIKK